MCYYFQMQAQTFTRLNPEWKCMVPRNNSRLPPARPFVAALVWAWYAEYNPGARKVLSRKVTGKDYAATAFNVNDAEPACLPTYLKVFMS